MKISVYTDGSFSRPYGGYGVVFIAHTPGKNRMRMVKSKRYMDTTNIRMEMKGVIHALENCDPGHQIDIYTDSEFCVKGINEWLPIWIETGKLTSKANPELWQRFMDARRLHEDGGSKLKFTWVRGHGASEFNKMADALANEARLTLNGSPTVSCKKDN